MNYGQSQAVMVLAGERMGFSMATTDTAKQMLSGASVHPMFAVAVEKEATSLHNQIHSDADAVNRANKCCAEIIAEHHLS